MVNPIHLFKCLSGEQMVFVASIRLTEVALGYTRLIPAIQSSAVEPGTRPSFEVRAPAAKNLPES